MTGLSGAGKTTIALRLEEEVRRRGYRVEVLDGDVIRSTLSKELGYSKEDRCTNIRRIAFVASLLARNGVCVFVAAISPYKDVRQEARQLIGSFVEVFVDCPLETLIKRDVKGLYTRALRGDLPNFTGVSDPYEPPEAAEVVLDTSKESLEESCAKIVAKLDQLGYRFPELTNATEVLDHDGPHPGSRSPSQGERR